MFKILFYDIIIMLLIHIATHLCMISFYIWIILTIIHFFKFLLYSCRIIFRKEKAMTTKEKAQLEYINKFLAETAYLTDINIDNKYQASMSYSMQLDYIGIGKIYNGLTLLDNFLYNYWGSYYTSHGMGFVSKNDRQTVFAPDLREKVIFDKDFYITGNPLWCINDINTNEHYLSDWFINENCNFDKIRMDEFCDLIHSLVDGKNYMLTSIYHPQGKILQNFGNICYYAFIKIDNNSQYAKRDEYAFYFLNCATHL